MPLPAKIQDEVIPVVRMAYHTIYQTSIDVFQLPLWALVSFGAFLLFKLGYGVLTFNNVPDAHAELMGQIDQARAELTKKGVQVD